MTDRRLAVAVATAVFVAALTLSCVARAVTRPSPSRLDTLERRVRELESRVALLEATPKDDARDLEDEVK